MHYQPLVKFQPGEALIQCLICNGYQIEVCILRDFGDICSVAAIQPFRQQGR